MKLICPICKIEHVKSVSAYNASIKRGGIIYCGKSCSGIGRRHNKTSEQLKAEKAEYDKLYREKNLDILKEKKKEYFKKDYAENPEKYREIRKKRMPEHVIYCRLPKARAKEREARYRRLGHDKTKECLICHDQKRLIDFEGYDVFPDKRNYMCKECESNQFSELGIRVRDVLQCIRSGLVKQKSKLKIRDIAKYPYLIESNKYLLLLKRLTK